MDTLPRNRDCECCCLTCFCFFGLCCGSVCVNRAKSAYSPHAAPEIEVQMQSRILALQDVDAAARSIGAKLVLRAVDDETGSERTQGLHASQDTAEDSVGSQSTALLRRDDALALVQRPYRDRPPKQRLSGPSVASTYSGSMGYHGSAAGTSVSTSTDGSGRRIGRKYQQHRGRDSDLHSLHVHNASGRAGTAAERKGMPRIGAKDRIIGGGVVMLVPDGDVDMGGRGAAVAPMNEGEMAGSMLFDSDGDSLQRSATTPAGSYTGEDIALAIQRQALSTPTQGKSLAVSKSFTQGSQGNTPKGTPSISRDGLPGKVRRSSTEDPKDTQAKVRLAMSKLDRGKTEGVRWNLGGGVAGESTGVGGGMGMGTASINGPTAYSPRPSHMLADDADGHPRLSGSRWLGRRRGPGAGPEVDPLGIDPLSGAIELVRRDRKRGYRLDSRRQRDVAARLRLEPMPRDRGSPGLAGAWVTVDSGSESQSDSHSERGRRDRSPSRSVRIAIGARATLAGASGGSDPLTADTAHSPVTSARPPVDSNDSVARFGPDVGGTDPVSDGSPRGLAEPLIIPRTAPRQDPSPRAGR